MDNNYQKKKQRKALIRKIVINTFVTLLIIAFVSTLGVYWGSNQNVKSVKIAEINKVVYTYQPGSPFSYIYYGIKDGMNRNFNGQVDSTYINQFALSRSVQLLINYGLIQNVAAQNGVEPSKEMLRNILEYTVRGQLRTTPDKGLLEYGRMEYANMSLSGENGDILNALGPISGGELYSYYDLENYTADAEFLFINVTNYIVGKVNESDVASYYETNIQRYATEAVVDDISVKSKAIAFEVSKFASEKGWEQALETYKGKYGTVSKVTLKNAPGTSKRFAMVIKGNRGQTLDKPQFESGEYHVMRIQSFPDFKILSKDLKASVNSDYVLANFASLKTKYDADIQNTVLKTEDLVKSKPDMKAAASAGMSYVKAVKISPVGDRLVDEKGNPIDLPLLQNDSWLDFIFSAQKNQVSQTFKTDAYIVIIKMINKGLDPKFSYANLGREDAMRYATFKNSATSKDWFAVLETKYPYKIFQDEVKKLASEQAAE